MIASPFNVSDFRQMAVGTYTKTITIIIHFYKRVMLLSAVDMVPSLDNELQSTMHNVFAITERVFLVANMFNTIFISQTRVS